MPPLQTARLLLEPLNPSHAPLLLALFNDADFLRFVGDKGLRTVADCEAYIATEVLPAQAIGIINYAVRERGGRTNQWLGTCGLLKRPYFDAPDLGYGFLPPGRGRGFARDAAKAVLSQPLHWNHLWAMVNPENQRSCALLTKAGFKPAPSASHNCPLPGVLVLQKPLTQGSGISPQARDTPGECLYTQT